MTKIDAGGMNLPLAIAELKGQFSLMNKLAFKFNRKHFFLPHFMQIQTCLTLNHHKQP